MCICPPGSLPLNIKFPYHTDDYDYSTQKIRTLETEKVSKYASEKWAEQYAAAQYGFVESAFVALVKVSMQAVINTGKVSHP